MEAEVHENFYSENESASETSENGASDENHALNQEIDDSQKTNLDSTPSVFFIHKPNKILKITTDALNCDNMLVNYKK